MASDIGYIRLILGPMGSGKTTALIMNIQIFNQKKKSTIVLKYAGDTRYSSDYVCTHNNVSYKATPCTKLSDMDDIIKDYQVIGIDEGQFYPDIKEFVLKWVNRGKIFIIAALDSDVNQKVFNQGLLELIPHSEKVKKLVAVCNNCSGKASFTKRKSDVDVGNDDDDELFGQKKMGAFEQYDVYCRMCLSKVKTY